MRRWFNAWNTILIHSFYWTVCLIWLCTTHTYSHSHVLGKIKDWNHIHFLWEKLSNELGGNSLKSHSCPITTMTSPCVYKWNYILGTFHWLVYKLFLNSSEKWSSVLAFFWFQMYFQTYVADEKGHIQVFKYTLCCLLELTLSISSFPMLDCHLVDITSSIHMSSCLQPCIFLQRCFCLMSHEKILYNYALK